MEKFYQCLSCNLNIYGRKKKKHLGQQIIDEDWPSPHKNETKNNNNPVLCETPINV